MGFFSSVLFYFFYIFSTKHVLVLWTEKGLSLISATPSPTPAASGSIHLLHCLCLVHQPSLPASRWVRISLVFLPIFITRHEPLKVQGLACLPPPQYVTPCLAQEASVNDLWNHSVSAQSPRWRLLQPAPKKGIRSDFVRVSPSACRLHDPVKDRLHSFQLF